MNSYFNMSHIFRPWGFKSNGRTVKINGMIGKQGVFRKHICKKCGKTHGQGKNYIPRVPRVRKIELYNN